MDAKQLVWTLCAALALGAACRSQSGSGATGSSGREATQGDTTCARQPGEPPAVGDGDEATTTRPCGSGHSVMGETAKRPDEL